MATVHFEENKSGGVVDALPHLLIHEGVDSKIEEGPRDEKPPDY